LERCGYMTAHRYSIALEVVAFFFVTIDLYGRARLKRAQKRLERARGTLEEHARRAGKYVGAALAGAGLIVALWMSAHLERYVDRAPLWLMFAASVIAYPLARYGGVGIVRGGLAGGDAVAGGLVKLLGATRVEGVLLGVGTMLFLTSKLVAWFEH